MRIINSLFLLSIFFAFSLQAQPYKLDFNIYYSAADQVAGTPVGWDAVEEGWLC